MVQVKICGVTSPEDAVGAAAAGASAIGLNFFPPSRRCVTMERAREIARALPRGVCRVGVFVDALRAQMQQAVREIPLDAVQLHGDESPEDCRNWPCKVIKAIRVRDREAVARMSEYPADLILADAFSETLRGGTGRVLPWEWLSGVDKDRLILAGGLDPDNVAEAVRRVRPWAVDVASGVESAPGVKDAEKMRRFVNNAQSA